VKILDGNVTTDKIADASVTPAKLSNGAVTTVNILDRNVTSDKLNVDVVDSFLTAGANVTLEKNVTTGVVTITSTAGAGGAGDVGDNSITTAKILDANVTGTKIAVDAISTAKYRWKCNVH